MNVVGKVGSLITKGVYSVATPFHPFGGAVDIIVVEQQDGTYRSTPWYVRFGKFQGVLKGAEKIVHIYVNGVETNFHMLLDNSGEAYFVREVVSGSQDIVSSDQVSNNFNSLRINQVDNIDNTDNDQNVYGENKGEVDNSGQSNVSRDDQSSLGSPAGSPGYSTYHYESFDEVENLVTSSEDSNSEVVLLSVDGLVLTAPISMDEENKDDVQLSIPQFHLGPGEGSSQDFSGSGDVWTEGLFCDLDSSTPTYGCQAEDIEDAKEITLYESEANSTGNANMGSSPVGTGAVMSKDDMFKSCLDLMSHIEGDDSKVVGSLSMELEKIEDSGHSPEISSSSNIIVEEIAAKADHEFKPCAAMHLPCSDLPCSAELQDVDIGTKDFKNNISVDSEWTDGQLGAHVCLLNSDLPCSDGPPTMIIESEDSEKKALDIENTLHVASEVLSVHSLSNDLERKDVQVESSPGRSATEECTVPEISEFQRGISGLGFEISLCGNVLRAGMGCNSAEEAFEAHRISEDEFKTSGPAIIKNGNLIVRYKGMYFSWDKVAHIIVGMAVFGSNFSVEPKDPILVEQDEITNAREEPSGIPPTSSRRWRLWPIPFRRVKSLQHTNSNNSSNEEVFLDSETCLQDPCAEETPSSNNNQSPRKQFQRTNIPTTEQIASLNLKDGQNTIAFSFSTRVLGKQQVDAHIYLWKWNARIVISDVDGTITRSDVLGQFMPLVGKDWTQSGVARLFSAIKENGYQLLFLSARAIVQAYLTRSFLLNLKQDGKALPIGPVVISPDGLFPSLYREVIRRAPHEFKIACLEDIRALFPSDYNPFYAGFGNRDTDELSYRKIGIPKGKIFIINPKGEVAIYNCTDVKSYTSLHTLVNDMFPPTSLAEQEDFNSWNYWKMPLPIIDC